MADQQSNIPENSTQEIPYGYCCCGCGGKTIPAKKDHIKSNHKKGEPVRFLRGHNAKGRLSRWWNGGISIHSAGYIGIKMPEHHMTDVKGYVFEHILVIEKALGKPYPKGATPHHVNEDKTDNSPHNLVLCQNKAYHNLGNYILNSRKSTKQGEQVR